MHSRPLGSLSSGLVSDSADSSSLSITRLDPEVRPMQRNTSIVGKLLNAAKKTSGGYRQRAKNASKRLETLRKLNALVPHLNSLEERVLLTVDITTQSQLDQYLNDGIYSIRSK